MLDRGTAGKPVHNPIDVVELALEKGATAVVMPVCCRWALIDLSDDVATKVQVLYQRNARAAQMSAEPSTAAPAARTPNTVQSDLTPLVTNDATR